MKMPFTAEQFFQVFGIYNTAIFPMQLIFFILCFAALYLLYRNAAYSGIVSAILGFFWVWMGLIYHLMFFAAINPAANIFGILFIIQGTVFLYSGVIKKNLVFAYRTDAYGAAGWIIILYGLVFYPVIGHFAGHQYPYAPELGAPCPTTIFTFGIFLFTTKISRWIIVIPFVWAIIGFFAAVNLGVIQDFGLIIAGLISVLLITYRDAKTKAEKQVTAKK